jgi:rod shape determining protein RodA
MQLKHLFILSLAGLVGIFFAYQLILKPYQKERLLGFVQPHNRTQEKSSPSVYNRNQALIAIGSGGLRGKGFGSGTQSQLKFLPERQTDFIFATATEEGGFILALIIVGLYSLLMIFLIKQMHTLPPARNLFVFYITTLLIWQVFINLSGNLGLMPITGLPLPFISYGGSSVVSLSLTLGIVQSMLKTHD